MKRIRLHKEPRYQTGMTQKRVPFHQARKLMTPESYPHVFWMSQRLRDYMVWTGKNFWPSYRSEWLHQRIQEMKKFHRSLINEAGHQ